MIFDNDNQSSAKRCCSCDHIIICVVYDYIILFILVRYSYNNNENSFHRIHFL